MAKEESPVYVCYQDHLLFRNADLNLCKPAVREAVGWIAKENDEAIWIIWERSAKPFADEKKRPDESGLVILKAEILEQRRLAILVGDERHEK